MAVSTPTAINVFNSTPSATLTWLIRNINTKADVTSKKFNSTNCRYSLQLYPEIDEITYPVEDFSSDIMSLKKNRSMVLLFGSTKEGHKEKVPIHYRFSILNAKGEKCNAQEGREVVPVASEHGEVAIFTISRDYLDADLGFSADGNVTFFCEIFELTEPNITTEFQANSLIVLSSNMKNLLDSGKGADVVLVASGVELKAHKLILSANSPVFTTIFDNESAEESRKSMMNFPDVSVEVLRELLRFIYSGQVQELETVALELFIVAIKYKMDSLKTHCEKYLSSSLTIETIPRIFQVAKINQEIQLKKSCINYIRNFANKMTEDKLESLIQANPKLFAQLFKVRACK